MSQIFGKDRADIVSECYGGCGVGVEQGVSGVFESEHHGNGGRSD